MTESPTILVIEDEEDLADLYTEWLNDKYNVITTYSSENALEQLNSGIDIALIDRRLPGISGDEVVERIQEMELDIQMAIVSAITPTFAVIGMGIDDYLVKPVTEDQLLALVDKMVQRATLEDTVQELERLKTTKETLESEMSEPELAESEEYQSLRDDIEELQMKANQITENVESKTDG